MRNARHRRFATLAFGAALCGVAVSAPEALSEAEQIQLTVLRHELSQFKPGDHPPPKAFCVGVRAHVGDPTPEFLRALAGSYPSLLSLRDCKTVCPDADAVLRQAQVLSACGYVTAGDVWFEPSGQGNVSVKFAVGPLWGRIGVYSLRKVEGVWVVQSYRLDAVS